MSESELTSNGSPVSQSRSTSLSNSLQTAQAAGGAGGVGGWVELARTTVGTTGDPLDVSSLSDKRFYMVLLDHQASGSSQPNGRFNSDSGSNYCYRFDNDGSAGTGVNSTKCNRYLDSR